MVETLTGKQFVESDISTWAESDYRRLLAEIEPIFNAAVGTPESDRSDVLFDLIEAYEAIHYPMGEDGEEGDLIGGKLGDAFPGEYAVIGGVAFTGDDRAG